jgi:hypothetical protein
MEDLFWLMVSEVSVSGHLASFLWVCGEVEHQNREDIAEQSSSLNGSQEAE